MKTEKRIKEAIVNFELLHREETDETFRCVLMDRLSMLKWVLEE